MTTTLSGRHEPLDDLDRQILSEIREACTVIDPPPADLADRVKFALTLSALEAEVAELQDIRLAGIRSEAPYAVTDTVTFTSSTTSLMITVTPERSPGEAPTVRVDGWITGGGLQVELTVGAIRLMATSDANGRLTWEAVPSGRARFLIHPITEGARPVVTPTVEI